MTGNVYITDDFMLETGMARHLYHEYAEGLPIIDYHCHLPPELVAADHRFANLAEIWLHGDHYKWRAMRANGVAERFCTGDASDREKFDKWAETVPYLLRNQLYPWTHLELNRVFAISGKLLGPDTAGEIWDACNERLAQPEFSARGIMQQMNVVLVCTTDDPVDSLEHHKTVADDPSFAVRMLPTWRPDKGMAVEHSDAFNVWVDALADAADFDIRDFSTYMEAIRKRHTFFHDMGCRLSDHGIETVYAEEYTQTEIETGFDKVRTGKQLDEREVAKFKSAMLIEFGLMDHEKGWTQQFHIGALRNTRSRMFEQLGPDTGFDSIADSELARPLMRLLDRLDSTDQLTKTIVYNLNPRDNELVATMCGNFQDGSVPGKMQFGTAWWYLDQKDGMERQIEVLSQMGLLSRFVGMVTDSRSFLSYPRHEYFRRILCNMLGSDMAKGLIPNDLELAGRLVRDVSYHNAANAFYI